MSGDYDNVTTEEVVLQGIGVSPGVVESKVFLVGVEPDQVIEHAVAPAEIMGEIGRFEEAIIQTRAQIREIQKNLEKQLRHADVSVMDAHLMVLDDRALIEEVVSGIRKYGKNAEYVLWLVTSKYAEALSQVEDDYLRERVADIKDVARRIIRNLAGHAASALGELKEKSVVVAHDLAPSETAVLPRGLALGFATDLGSPTSHTAMMARAMEIPAVVGMHDISRKVLPGQKVIVDGNKGIIIINPTAQRLEEYGKLVQEREIIRSDLDRLKTEDAATKSGERIALLANIEKPDDVDAVLAYGAEGVGLFRSEYFYMSSRELPTEEELVAAYTRAVEKLRPASITIRTLDIGGDKFAPYMGVPLKANPFLGLRAIRISLAEPEVFKTQLRAILRVSSIGPVRVMYPMITNREEMISANKLLEEAKQELRDLKIPFDEEIKVGAMIETPSAALTADIIAEHADFLSIGTNDLVQYTLAVDRVNEQVAYLYQPTHPSILKLINSTIAGAKAAGVTVCVCGEMAADPLLCPLLLGMGIREVSVPPSAVPVVKDAIRSVSLSDAVELADAALELGSAEEVIAQCRDLISRKAPEILELLG